MKINICIQRKSGPGQTVDSVWIVMVPWRRARNKVILSKHGIVVKCLKDLKRLPNCCFSSNNLSHAVYERKSQENKWKQMKLMEFLVLMDCNSQSNVPFVSMFGIFAHCNCFSYQSLFNFEKGLLHASIFNMQFVCSYKHGALSSND